MRSIKGYRSVALPICEDGSGLHYIYIKEHSDKGSSLQDPSQVTVPRSGKVLFVGNVDYFHSSCDNNNEDYVQEIIRVLFQNFGEIDSVSVSKFQEDGRSVLEEKTRFAHVSFMKKNSVKAALTANDQLYHDIGRTIAEKYGKSFTVKSSLDILKSQPLFFDVKASELKESIASFMKEFDENEEIKLLELKRKSEIPDDDGFVLVKSK